MISSGLASFLIRLFTGVNLHSEVAEWGERQRIFFANHTSHLDFLVVWAVLPADLRARVRPVAARDYWAKNKTRLRLATGLFNAILIERKPPSLKFDLLAPIKDALAAGDSVLIFPEGTRSQDGEIAPFKGGLHALAEKFPDAELVPVYLENLNRILPKGEFLPVPFLGVVRIGRPIQLEPEEPKKAFLERAHAVMESLREKESA